MSEAAARVSSANSTSQKGKRAARNSKSSGVSGDDEPLPPIKSDPHQLMNALKTKLAEGLGPAKFAQVRLAPACDGARLHRCSALARALVCIGAPCVRARARVSSDSSTPRAAARRRRSLPSCSF